MLSLAARPEWSSFLKIFLKFLEKAGMEGGKAAQKKI